MFNRVLVGVDEHQGGQDAVALARRLVNSGGELTLAHIYPSELRAWRGASPSYDAVGREASIALLERRRDELAPGAELRSVGAASVGRGLHLLAETIEADLLVVGSSRRSMLGRVVVGDDTRHALNGAPCSVAVVPAGYASESGPITEIGVGYDGSAESDHALAFARRLAHELGARLSAFEAVSLPSFVFAAGAVAISEETVDELVDRARERVAELGDVEPHAAYGHASEELAVYSASLSLLIVGSRDYGPIGRLVHGSTSLQLARISRCPLLVLTRATRAHGPALPGLDEPVAQGVAHEV